MWELSSMDVIILVSYKAKVQQLNCINFLGSRGVGNPPGAGGLMGKTTARGKENSSN